MPADDLRDRYAAAILRAGGGESVGPHTAADAVLTVRDDELERLRAELATVLDHDREAVRMLNAAEADLERLVATVVERDALKAAEKRMRDLIARLRARDEIESDEIADMVESALDAPRAPHSPESEDAE